MYKSQDELMTAIYTMAAPGGSIFQALGSIFFRAREFPWAGQFRSLGLLMAQSSHQSEVTVQRNIPGHGAVLVFPTYDDLLMQRVTGLIAHECEQLSYVAQYNNVEDWPVTGR